MAEYVGTRRRARAKPAAAAANREARQGKRYTEKRLKAYAGSQDSGSVESYFGPQAKAARGGRPARSGRYAGSRGMGRGRARFRATDLLPGQATDTAGKLLAAELITGFVIVCIRALGDYELTDSGTSRGTLNTPQNGGYGPFTVLAGLIGSFFALSFLAAGGGKRAKWATAFGALIVMVLTMKSMDEIEIVAGYITASPSTRTVLTAAHSSAATQPWGAAAQVPSGGGAALTDATLTAAYSGGGASGAATGAAFYGAPFSLGGGGGGGASSSPTSSNPGTA